jgi:uncharacterized membrane protein
VIGVGIRGVVLAAGLLAAGGAAAQTLALPTLADVNPAAAGVTLEVREGPSLEAAAIGALEPGAQGVEIVALDPTGNWGRVNLGEASGWIELGALTPRAEVWPEGGLPAGLRCFGTEPFWTVRPEGDALVETTPESETRMALTAALGTGAPGDLRRVLVGEAEDGTRITLVVAPEACSDGMSDRAFGVRADLVRGSPDGVAYLAGCCSIAP